jgi:hypothetical protein
VRDGLFGAGGGGWGGEYGEKERDQDSGRDD